ARSSDRIREIALRISIGAGSSRMVRQLLTESVVLTVLAGALGNAMAAGALRWLTAYRLPRPFPPNQFNVRKAADLGLFAFRLAVSLLTGALAGVLPALNAMRTDPNAMMKGGMSSTGAARRWAVRDVLVPVQIALCSALVVASFASIRGLTKAFAASLGVT